MSEFRLSDAMRMSEVDLYAKFGFRKMLLCSAVGVVLTVAAFSAVVFGLHFAFGIWEGPPVGVYTLFWVILSGLLIGKWGRIYRVHRESGLIWAGASVGLVAFFFGVMVLIRAAAG